MSENKPKRIHRDILEDLRDAGKPSEVVLLAWGIIEMNLDNVILREYGLSSQDPKAEILVGAKISDKLALQKRLGYLSEEDYTILRGFKAKRDSLFHKGGIWFPNMREYEKAELTQLAIKAADVAHALFDRAFSQSRPEVPRLDSPKIRRRTRGFATHAPIAAP